MLTQAESSHRAALEAAQLTQQGALEAVRVQSERERHRWLTEARRTSYRLFQHSLAEFRRALMADEVDVVRLGEAYYGVHDTGHEIAEVGPNSITGLTSTLTTECELLRHDIALGHLASRQEREDLWNGLIAPLRKDLDEAIYDVLASDQ
ncbi:hypothetical protein [Streptomyces sp. LUP47B]|uniref:hypothetical protein n=1 Tax=unclassified Streptomyces TaxID=2593676 RepID=UPI00114D0385|nr:hypothetical protein [Streptomyces sp. LUP47B]